MDRRTERSIKKALNLIQKGEHAKARPILTDLLKADPNQAEAWFLLSYTVPERGRRIYALRQALNANPDFTRAEERLSKLTGQPPSAPTRPQQPGDRPAAPAFVPPTEETSAANKSQVPDQSAWDRQDFADEGEDWSDGEAFEDEEAPRKGGGARVLLGVLLVVAMLAALYFLAGDALRGIFSGGGSDTQVTATEISAFRTLPPTWTPAGAINATPGVQSTPTPTQEGDTPQGFQLDLPAPDSATQQLMDEIRAEVLAVRGLGLGAEADDYLISRDQAVQVLEQLFLTESVN